MAEKDALSAHVVDAPVGTPALDIVISAPSYGHPLVLMSMTPEVVVDGVVAARGWGRWIVPVGPGAHSVVVYVNRFGEFQYPAQLEVEVPAAARATVYYRLPALRHCSAAIGTTPQRSAGAGAMAILLLLPVVMAVAGLALVVLLLIAVA
ncbi:hypothetical protein [Nocardia sp. BMG51109]|uniref:hypothetical protein n=1 Tax=Nocardia sp. BMG51109 TaxID=1056816 RepID=UPI0012EC1F43|nr:hypothetical protein [Nocardia sp. BMG51109]